MKLKPTREHATNNSQTYFVTSDTWERRALFHAEQWARLFFKTLLSHRGKAYLLHEFVLMPDHFHLLITPSATLERAVQFIKGGFSHRAKRVFGSSMEIWRRGFSDHRIRDAEDYGIHVRYIHLNPVRKYLCEAPAEYHSSAYPGWKLDPVPQRLKPPLDPEFCGTAKAVPFQDNAKPGCTATAVSLVSDLTKSDGGAEAPPLQTHTSIAEPASLAPKAALQTRNIDQKNATS